MLAIQTKSLTKYYGQQIGIKNISLEIQDGEIFGFIGPNGAGKSTTIRTLLGLLIPQSGTATIFGKDIRTDGQEIRKKIGYLPSEVNYYNEMTSRELLEYHCRFYGIDDYTEVDRLAAVFKLDLNKQITDLSFGNKKKCGIIQSIIHKPDLLIMDEPTSGLDPLMKNVFFELLEEENKKGTTIFFSSHVLSEIQRICDRAAVIRDGEIVATEDIQSLLKKQMKKVTLVFQKKPADFYLPKGVQKPHWFNNKLTCEYVGPVKELTQWMASLDLVDCVLEEPDLESIFMNYYQHEQ
ncbi:MAG: ABC-2 type transport system ATP-binding protein [Patescibacteria group bacterium]|jgi:ABC-2 type transport system ATP-binding protein